MVNTLKFQGHQSDCGLEISESSYRHSYKITTISTLKFQGNQMHQVVSEVTLYHVIVKAQLAGIYDCKPTESEDRAEGQG